MQNVTADLARQVFVVVAGCLVFAAATRSLATPAIHPLEIKRNALAHASSENSLCRASSPDPRSSMTGIPRFVRPLDEVPFVASPAPTPGVAPHRRTQYA
jgi:hypothetical protein